MIQYDIEIKICPVASEVPGLVEFPFLGPFLVLTDAVYSGSDPLARTVPPPGQVLQVGPHVNTVVAPPRLSLQSVRFTCV